MNEQLLAQICECEEGHLPQGVSELKMLGIIARQLVKIERHLAPQIKVVTAKPKKKPAKKS